MTAYIITSLVSLIVGAALWARFGAIGVSDLTKLEQSLMSHVTATEGRIKAEVAKIKSTAAKVAADVKNSAP